MKFHAMFDVLIVDDSVISFYRQQLVKFKNPLSQLFAIESLLVLRAYLYRQVYFEWKTKNGEQPKAFWT